MLSHECRAADEGRLDDPTPVLREVLGARFEQGAATQGVYGEKNVTYYPFIQDIHKLFGSRFAFLHRDGRDVARSMVDWHNAMFANIYRECQDPGQLSRRAVSHVARTLLTDDGADIARPRPKRGDPIFDRWETCSRFEMSTWYWNYVNHRYLAEFAELPADAFHTLSYTGVSAKAIVELADFLGLKGLSEEVVDGQLNQRINSLADRGSSDERFPHWTHWDSAQRDTFEAIASDGMRTLGYWEDERTYWRPRGYGSVWNESENLVGWYEQMYSDRTAAHDFVIDWVTSPPRSDSIRSIADFGCGIGLGYVDAFADRQYVGYDLEGAINHCRQHYSNPRHAFHAKDFIAEDLGEMYDLVFSSGTIDNSYDADRFLAAMTRASKGWVILHAYRGWFPELTEHQYKFLPDQQVFHNSVSPHRMIRTLDALGFETVEMRPFPIGKENIENETLVIARRK